MTPSDRRPYVLRSVWRPDTWTVGALNHVAVAGAALLAAHVAKAFSDLRPDTVDFSLFWWSMRWWRTGESLYALSRGLLNYNAPQFHVLILPLASLPLPVAFGTWTLANAGAAVLVIRMAICEAGETWPVRERRLLLAAVLAAAGVGATIHLGQVSWLIALFVTLGWRAARHARWAASGVWLGVAASLKPFLLLVLAIFILRRRWSALAAAAAGGAVSVSIGVLVFGTAAATEWLRLLSVGAPSQQVAYFINASLAAVSARAGLGPAINWPLGIVVSMLTVMQARRSGIDRAFLLLLIGSLLACPLGWIYYMPMLAGPMIVMARERQLPEHAWYAWPLLVCPPIGREFLQFNRVVSLTVGSAYTWGLVLLWLAAAHAKPADEKSVSPSMGSTPASGRAAS